jgi:hypothetical protein
MPFGVDEKGMILAISTEGEIKSLDNDTQLKDN